MSTHRTELYQNHATAIMFPMEMETTVPCAPMGTAAIRMATKIASSRKNRSLNAAVVTICCNIRCCTNYYIGTTV